MDCDAGLSDEGERRLRITLWVCALAGALALNVANLFLGDLNQDEGWYLYAARLTAEGQVPFVDFATTQGPVMTYVYAAAHPLVRAFGVAGGRLFTSLLGLAAAFAAAGCAHRLLRTSGAPAHSRAPAQAALITFAFVGLNVFQSYFTTIVKTYSLAALLLLLGFLCLTATHGRPAPWRAALAGALMLLAAATRLSALFVPTAALIALLLARDVPRRDGLRRAAAFVLGAAVAGLVTVGTFLWRAPAATWFGLVEYHAGREAGSVFSWLAYKGGFVSRLCLAYAAAAGCGVATLAFGIRRQRRNRMADEGQGSGATWLDGAAWGGVAAVSVVHALAPFPYDDYQAMIYPLFAAALAAAITRLRIDWRVTVGVFGICLVCVVGSPIIQSWFISPRDRIWWPLKAKAPLTVLRETAAQVRALPGAAPGALLLTQDPYLAVETGLRIPGGLELGQFSYFPDWPRGKAERCHVLNREMLREMLRTAAAPVAAFSGYGFAIRCPEVLPLSEEERGELLDLLAEQYLPQAEVEPFGQADTRLTLYIRKPAGKP